MLYSNEDILKASDEAFKEGFDKGRISGADRHYGEVCRIRYMNRLRKIFGMPPLEEPKMEGH